MFYLSVYRHGVDEKRRLQIPAKWRPQGEVTFTLLLWERSNQPPCLLALPTERMLALAQKLAEMPFSDPNAEALRRLLGGSSDQVTLDKAGRICLPEEMAKAAGIQADAVLVGMVDRFQIWNPQNHETATKVDNALRQEAYKLI